MIRSEIVLNYYDGPTEFIGRFTPPGQKYEQTCYGWWIYEDESIVENRLFAIWSRDHQGVKMIHVADVRENDIDWSDASF